MIAQINRNEKPLTITLSPKELNRRGQDNLLSHIDELTSAGDPTVLAEKSNNTRPPRITTGDAMVDEELNNAGALG